MKFYAIAEPTTWILWSMCRRRQATFGTVSLPYSNTWVHYTGRCTFEDTSLV